MKRLESTSETGFFYIFQEGESTRLFVTKRTDLDSADEDMRRNTRGSSYVLFHGPNLTQCIKKHDYTDHDISIWVEGDKDGEKVYASHEDCGSVWEIEALLYGSNWNEEPELGFNLGLVSD